jgi:hypothetical protein
VLFQLADPHLQTHHQPNVKFTAPKTWSDQRFEAPTRFAGIWTEAGRSYRSHSGMLEGIVKAQCSQHVDVEHGRRGISHLGPRGSMTLILTLGNAWSIHQSSDYRLTNVLTGKPSQMDEAGAKQLSVHKRNYNAYLSFTGIASIGAYKTRAWMAKVISMVPEESTPEHTCP